MKPKLRIYRKSWKMLTNLCHFSSYDLPRKDGSVTVAFPSVHAAEIIDFVTENFKMSFSDFRGHVTDIRINFVTTFLR
jgi:hypothetical protein